MPRWQIKEIPKFMRIYSIYHYGILGPRQATINITLLLFAESFHPFSSFSSERIAFSFQPFQIILDFIYAHPTLLSRMKRAYNFSVIMLFALPFIRLFSILLYSWQNVFPLVHPYTSNHLYTLNKRMYCFSVLYSLIFSHSIYHFVSTAHKYYQTAKQHHHHHHQQE